MELIETSYESKLSKEIQYQISNQKKIILSGLLPSVLLNLDSNSTSVELYCVALEIDSFGYANLCEKYALGQYGGVQYLIATFNAHLGAIIECIHFFDGDVFKCGGTSVCALWTISNEELMVDVIHKVISCALFIKKKMGQFETNCNTTLHLKQSISCGRGHLHIIGNDSQKNYILLGQLVTDCKLASKETTIGEITLAPSAWSHCDTERYEIVPCSSKYVTILDILYSHSNQTAKREYLSKCQKLSELCDKHISTYISLKHKKTKRDVALLYDKLRKDFLSDLPTRTIQINMNMKNIENFVISPILQKLNEGRPLDYLSEMRNLTTMFVLCRFNLLQKDGSIINRIFVKILDVILPRNGFVVKVVYFDKHMLTFIVFYLRYGDQNANTQTALKCAMEIKRDVFLSKDLYDLSISLTTGLVFCGVVGHPYRQEFVVVGENVPKAMIMSSVYHGKITCDQNTYALAKLPTCYFDLQKTKPLKGIQNPGYIYEYNEYVRQTLIEPRSSKPILGRDNELEIIQKFFSKLERSETTSSMLFLGESKIGKSRLLQEIFRMSLDQMFITAFYSANIGNLNSPYYGAIVIFEQFYDELNKRQMNGIFNTSHPNDSEPSDYWAFRSLLRTDLYPIQHRENIEKSRQDKIIQLFMNLAKRQTSFIFIIDNINQLDTQSLFIFMQIIERKSFVLIASTNSDKEICGHMTNVLHHPLVKVYELKGIDIQYCAALACQFLQVSGIPRKLETLLQSNSGGHPGWIYNCVMHFTHRRMLEVIEIKGSLTAMDIVTPSVELITKETNRDNDSFNTDSNLLSIAILGENFQLDDESLKNADDLASKIYNTFNNFEQKILQIGSLIGGIFTSRILQVMLEIPTISYLRAIKSLFDTDVFQCETKNIKFRDKKYFFSIITDSSSSDDEKSLCDIHFMKCACFIDSEMETMEKYIASRYDLPEYPFCRLLNFKSNLLQKIAFNTITPNEKINLHSRIVYYLENQNNLCSNCSELSSVFAIKKFNDFMLDLGLSSKPSNISLLDSTNSVDQPTFKSLQQIIRKHIYEHFTPETDLDEADENFEIKNNRRSFRLIPVSKCSELWNPNHCYCGTILARVYYQLIKHSKEAKLLTQHIYFLLQEANVLMVMSEFSEAIKFLKTASELCISDSCHKDPELDEKVRQILFARAHTNIGDAYLELRKNNAARIHLSIALRQYNIPMIALEKRFLWKENCFHFQTKNRYIYDYNKSVSIPTKESVRCLFLISILMLRTGSLPIAKNAIQRCIKIMKISNSNLFMLCDAIANAIDIYNYNNNTNMCSYLERVAYYIILRTYSNNDIMDLMSIGKLLAVCFAVRFMHGQIRQALRIGFRAFELNSKLQAKNAQLRVMTLLAFGLLLRTELDEAVVIINQIFTMRESKYDEATIWYHALCLDVYLESSYTIEKISIARNFAQNYFFSKELETIKFVDVEKLTVANMFLYYCRIGNWQEAVKWKGILSIVTDQEYSLYYIYILLKYVQCLLLLIVNEISQNKFSVRIQQYEDKLLNIFKLVQKSVFKWPVFLPRYYHMKAYYNKIKNKKKSKKYLVKANAISLQQENELETFFIQSSIASWAPKHNNPHYKFWFSSKPRESNSWNSAGRNSAQEWIYLMYDLPLPTPYR